MKAATLALVVKYEEGSLLLVEALSDDREITYLETGLSRGEPDALDKIYELRANQAKEEDEFGDYVEELLSQPFVRPEIREHGVQWLRSKNRIEQYQRSEADAAKVIADYAYQVFKEDPKKVDFFLAGPTNRVRIKILVLDQKKGRGTSSSRAA